MNYEFDLNDEIRCDFLVDTERKKIWAVELDLLNELQRVCKKYDLKCFALGGTLLGANRHKGFIPWDDDLDVGLSRRDYDKLCEIAKDEFVGPYFFQTALTDKNYFIGSARLRNSETTGIINGFDKHIYNNGIFIDIYVYDEMPDNDKKIKRQIKKLNRLAFALNNYHHINATNRMGVVLAIITEFFVRKIYTYDGLYERYINLCKKNNNKSGKLGLLCIPTFIRYLATKKGISNLIEMPFENTTILVPYDYDFMLHSAYHDYMSFPPKESRGKWHENIILFDPNISYVDYYSIHKEKYSNVLTEYKQLNIHR